MPEYDAALAAGFWSQLPREVVDKLFVEGAAADVPAGMILAEAQALGQIALVLDGFVRMFVRSKLDRQITVSYARMGDTIGLTSALAGPCRMGVQALSVCKLWVISVEALTRHALADARLAWALAQESGRRTYDTVEELAENMFGTVRQRVARHLLDLVVAGEPDEGLIAPISQQELANAAGTAREVVSRVLQQFRSEGVVKVVPHGVQVLDATQLYEQAQLAD